MTESNGTTASGFEGVRRAFEANFAKGLEIGAAFSAYHRGHKVVDLWGGTADVVTGRAWDERTLALVFSTTKGATAVCGRPARRRRAGRALLARVRRGWQGKDPRFVLAVASSRARVDRRRDDLGGGTLVGPGRRRVG